MVYHCACLKILSYHPILQAPSAKAGINPNLIHINMLRDVDSDEWNLARFRYWFEEEDVNLITQVRSG